MRKPKLKRTLCSLLLTAAMAVTVTACGSDSSGGSEEVVDVRIGYFPNITHTQALVMKNQGTLEEKWEDKCNVTWTSFNAGPEETEAIFAGEIDIGYIGPVPALSANAQSDGDVKIISNVSNAGAVLLKRKDAGIETVADLDGKTIAVPQLGNTQHLCLLNILAENGLDTIDNGGTVTVSASSNADIVNLIDNGSVDAALVPEPWGTTIEKNGNAEVLLDYDEVFLNGDYPVAVVVASKDFIDEHPDLVEEFLEEHENATLYINDNLEEAEAMVNEEIEEATGKALDDDVIAGAFTRMTISDELNKDAVMKFGEISLEYEFIDEMPEEDDVFATEFN